MQTCTRVTSSKSNQNTHSAQPRLLIIINIFHLSKFNKPPKIQTCHPCASHRGEKNLQFKSIKKQSRKNIFNFFTTNNDTHYKYTQRSKLNRKETNI